MNKTVFITGTSSGLGKLTAIRLAEMGWNVAATMRSPERETELTRYDNIRIFKLDVTKVDQVRAAVEQAIDTFGQIDVVVNNAGMGTYGALELAEEDAIDWQFAVNARGPINVIRGFLPHFRNNGGGMFINISSFMGVTTAVPLGSLYNMSKFALEGLTEGLYYELKPLNIELRLIEQGGSTGNNFVQNITWNRNENIRDYDPLMTKVSELMASRDSSQLDDPQVIVDAIVSQATGESSNFRTVVGAAGNGLLAMRNSMPIEQYLETIASNYK
ncbi:NADP-dependent 3-hydroxy acid dehydrogenase YdfG [Paenibacillus taihuensis]|uniref:NADP-dependent 3-hydroxy acid dehydrogenase YdfG n=1 Tax=Paenibacillus taihuensis TaxID=1156355 RepID=A0A3D9R0V7_9BACL|nr:SDR family oxidoreductase [Paenibacillus taihuensis]REE67637.1 NADP-dependent 3-hydroxy acid dehydrogenase YdfG [Paenibacillus taihuensis]